MSSDTRVQQLYEEHKNSIYLRTDRLFSFLLILQWFAAVALALFVTPYTWSGLERDTNPHVWEALLIGALVVSFPVYLAQRFPGSSATRHVIAIAQMLMAGIFVHLTGGRIETHFHYFGSLAFLSFYRDWRVVITATLVAGVDHFVRGVFWPYSFFGTFAVSQWRWLEHVAWVAFEDAFLIYAIRQSLREMYQIAERQAGMESVQTVIEAEVQQRTEELRHEVKERREAEERIRQVAAELQRSNRELESFASVASHDLQEPLRKIQAFGDRLKRKLGDESLVADDMDRIQNAASRMQRLIEDLLMFSRVTTKGKPFKRVDLKEVVQGVLGDLEVRIEKTDAQVELSDLPEIDADPTQMRQLFQNLIANALKFQKPGERPRIAINSIKSEDGMLAIEVRDNGIGFEEKYQEKIFGVFQRLHDQKTYEGTGIGLAVCKKIAHRHGGDITATSEGPGHGATFTITIPEAIAPTELAAA